MIFSSACIRVEKVMNVLNTIYIKDLNIPDIVHTHEKIMENNANILSLCHLPKNTLLSLSCLRSAGLTGTTEN